MRRPGVLSHAENNAITQLCKEAAEVKRLQSWLKVRRRNRDVVIRKLRVSGFSLRDIEMYAGISNVEILRICQREPGGTK